MNTSKISQFNIKTDKHQKTQTYSMNGARNDASLFSKRNSGTSDNTSLFEIIESGNINKKNNNGIKTNQNKKNTEVNKIVQSNSNHINQYSSNPFNQNEATDSNQMKTTASFHLTELNKLQTKEEKIKYIRENGGSQKFMAMYENEHDINVDDAAILVTAKFVEEREANGEQVSEEELQLMYSNIFFQFNTIDENGNNDGKISNKKIQKIVDSDRAEETCSTIIILANTLGENESDTVIDDEEAGNDLSNAAKLAQSGKSVDEIINIYNNPKCRENIDLVIQMSEMGLSAEQITTILDNHNLNNDFTSIIELSKNGVGISDVVDMLNNSNCKGQIANVLKLAELGKSYSEIMTILNSSNCRKAMSSVIKLIQMGKSSTEIVDIFNNQNAVLNSKETIKLSSSGKQADEINKINNNANCLKNMDEVVNLAQKGMNANDIISILNNPNVTESLLDNTDFDNINFDSEKNINENDTQRKPENAAKYGSNNTLISKIKYYNINENDVETINSETIIKHKFEII